MKKNRILMAVLAVVLCVICLTLFPTEAKAAQSGYLTYEISGGGAIITDCDESISGAFTIPSTLGNYPVVAIDDDAFSCCVDLTKIVIPDTVEAICPDEFGDSWGAFYGCEKLQEVVIGDGLKEIPQYTFYQCSRLKSVTIGGSVKTIGYRAFAESGLRSLTIPDNVLKIDDWAFQSSKSLSSLELGNGVTTIGLGAFDNCDSLLSVVIPDNVTTMEGSGDEDYASGAFSCCNNLREVTIGNGLYEIEPYSFGECPNLKIVTIGESVDTIGDFAFSKCGLETVFVPGNVFEIGYAAFYNCSKLKEVIISDGVDTIGDYAFEGCGIESLVIPDSVVTIGDRAFNSCKNMATLDLGNGVETIGRKAFENCDSLLTVEIPDSVRIMKGDEDMESGAFSYCNNLREVSIGDGIYEIAPYTFAGCSALKIVTIGDSVETISVGAFDDCKALSHVYYAGEEDDWEEISIESYNKTLTSAVRHNEMTCVEYTTEEFCTETKYYCGICGDYLKSMPVDGEHEYDNTCDTTCNKCPATRTINHSYNSATCTAPKTCKVCGTTSGSAKGHDYAAATCTKAKTCKTCGTTSGSAKGHSYADATCTKAKTCKVCGATSGSAKGHNYADATCTKAKTCKTCGATSGSAKGHNYAAATCTKAKTCKTCGTTSGKALGHSYKAATCTAAKTCKNCGATSGKALGHSYKTTTTKATLSKNGSIVKKCTTCGKVESTKAIKYVKTIKLSKTSFVYNGKVQKPTVTVKDSAGKSLVKGTDYDVTYASGCKKAGTYKVTVKFKGNYSGTKTLTFKILPAVKVATQPKTNKVKVGEKIKFTVKATGTGLKYQWQYSTNGKTWKNCSASAAKKASFSFTSKTSHDGNYYRCKVTDSAGNVVYTKAVRAYVLGIEKQPVKKTVTKNKTAKFSVEASGNGLKYQWQYSTDGGKTWKTCSGTAAQKAAFSFKAKISQNGYYFRCKITDSAKNVIYTSKVKLTVKK